MLIDLLPLRLADVEKGACRAIRLAAAQPRMHGVYDATFVHFTRSTVASKPLRK